MESKCANQDKPARSGNKFAALAVVMMVMTMPGMAFAQAAGDGTSMFCYIAQYFKGIVGAAALTVIMMWAIEHIFGVAKLHDVVIKVGVAAGLVILAVTVITNSGLTVSCTGF